MRLSRIAVADGDADMGDDHASDSNIQICVNPWKGEPITLTVDLTDTIDKVKTRIQNTLGTPPDQQQLIFAKQTLINSRTLSDYNVKMKSVLLVQRLRARRVGGG